MSDDVIEPNLPKHQRDFYRSIKEEITKWAQGVGDSHEYEEYILLAPALFRLLGRLSLDADVPVRRKAEVAVAISYFAAPMDAIPEGMIGPSGYVDDIALSAYVVNRILDTSDEAVVRRHWPKEEPVEDVVEGILEFAHYSIGPQRWEKIKEQFDRTV